MYVTTRPSCYVDTNLYIAMKHCSTNFMLLYILIIPTSFFGVLNPIVACPGNVTRNQWVVSPGNVTLSKQYTVPLTTKLWALLKSIIVDLFTIFLYHLSNVKYFMNRWYNVEFTAIINSTSFFHKRCYNSRIVDKIVYSIDKRFLSNYCSLF
jgi:hypothetical protein